MQHWYQIDNVEQIDSPALLLYKERISENIELVKRIANGRTDKLRPHVKTNKIWEVCALMMEAGIHKFKCATVAEAEMLAMAGAPDVLLAYQPVGPKIGRFFKLVETHPATRFSCLVDNEENARILSNLCMATSFKTDVYIDLNVGMNRTGVQPEKAVALVKAILTMSHLRLLGLHGYDGHIHDTDLILRQQAADISFDIASRIYREIQPWFSYPLIMIMGGTPTFSMHIDRENCECSPGTFVFWDWGYAHMLSDLQFQYAALVLTRIISIVDTHHICVDLGYKAVAAESPLPRVHFLNAPEAIPEAHSEEHLILRVPDSTHYAIGDVLYGVPVHICPTVALYDTARIIESGNYTTTWKVIARDRTITI